MFSTNFILFSLGGVGVSLLELLSVLSGLTCVFLAGRGKTLNFWFGYVYCILLFALFMQKHLYSSMILQPISMVINVIGHYRWTHPNEKERNKDKELIVTKMSAPFRALNVILVVLLALVWGWIVQQIGQIWPDVFPPAKIPILDSFVTMMILTAQYLSAQKKIECWAAWLAVNITNIILYILAGLVFMPIVSACYLVLAVLGYKSWKQQMKEQ
ncbi:MAG: nicotinamide riboside transporter PnuC [Bacteroidales bacterium]|nr:nicotinamide riboside transporter PnuC [Bacteroidales bacterium]MDD3200572.1 nicotinamide riboside transporter PnuC [Bacteroidales bacterium]